MKTNDIILSEEKLSISAEMVKIYDEFFVPAMLAELAEVMAKEAGIEKGNKVLDVACGTGIVTRTVKENYNADVTGVDINKDMLSVAKGKSKEIQWIEGPAESLPFANNLFDAVTCQLGLMFFNDRAQALHEMIRVVKTGKKVVVAVWDKIENIPGYQALYELIHDQFGESIARELLPPFALGDKEFLKKLFTSAGYKNFEIKTKGLSAKFPSIRLWMHAEVRGWVFSGMVTDEQLKEFTEKAEKVFKKYTDESGNVRFDTQIHIITAMKD